MRFVAVAALLIGALWQQPSQPPPRFQTGVDVVLLDVTVLDRARRPVRGLTASDFTILEEGRPQQIVSFEELSAPEPDGSLAPWMREVAPDIRTNASDDRRIVLLVLDDANITFHHTERVKHIGRRIIEQLGHSDQATVIYTGNNARSQELTNDRKALRAAVERYADTLVPRMAGSDMPGQYAVQTVRRASESLMAIPNRRKALIFVSSLAVNFYDPNLDTPYRLQQALLRAQRANITIYPINPAGLEVDVAEAAAPVEGRTLVTPVDPGRDLAADTARIMAEHTGGFAVTNSNTFDAQISQIFRETGSYYLIGFQSAHRDGKFRRLEVRTTRPEVTVRSRNGYNAAKLEREAKIANAEELPLPLLKSLSEILPNPDVPIRVAAAPFAIPGRNAAMVAIALGVQQPVSPGEQRVVENIELMATAYDTQFRSRAAFRQTAQLTLRPADGTTEAKYEIFSRLQLNPGRYQLRFAVHSALLKKTGSVYHDVEIPDFARTPLSVSGVVIAAQPALPSAPKNFLASVVPVSPTTRRVFLRGHHPVAFLRVYQGGSRPPLTSTISTSIVDAGDRTVHSSIERLSADRFGAARAADHRFDVPLDLLTPGAYLLRFKVTAAQHTVTREVRFAVR